MRRLLFSAALFALMPAQVPAQQKFGWLDLISPDRMAQQMLQMGILALRTQMDLKYGDMAVDLLTGRVTLTDVQIWPLPPWDVNGDCEIKIARITLRSGALDRIDHLRFKAQMSGAEAPLDCLPPDARGALGMAGITTLDVPRLTVDVDYGVPGSDAVARVFGVVENAAAVDLTARFAYVWFDGRDDIEEPEPVVFLENATLTVENRGAWEALKGQLPPPYTDPAGAPLLIEGMVGSILADMNRGASGSESTGDPTALTDPQRAFLDSAIAVWPAFLGNPDTLVLETGLETDTYLDFKAMERDPREAFATLKPRLALARAELAKTLPVALLKQAMGPDVGAMPEADRRTAGLALINGDGVPRDLDAGFALLDPIAKAGDGDAALAIARALEMRAPEDAYIWALVAGRNGTAGASALLDRLEDEIAFALVIDLQGRVSGNDSHPVDALQSISAVRDQAAMRLSGRGMARSYAVAAMWAMLGKALGDPESADILGDIDEHVRLAGADAQTAWRPVEQRASELAIKAWLGEDLPARFAR